MADRSRLVNGARLRAGRRRTPALYVRAPIERSPAAGQSRGRDFPSRLEQMLKLGGPM